MEPRGRREPDDSAETDADRVDNADSPGRPLGHGRRAGFAAVDIGGFAYAGGWLRPVR